MIVNKKTILDDLAKLGIKSGDTLLVRANLGAIGVREGKRSDRIRIVLEALLESVGVTGTLVSLAYTPSYFINPSIDNIFSIKTKSNAGILPNAMMSYPDAKRSLHPTNSVIAIGLEAESIILEHGPSSLAYKPVRRLVELNAKMLNIGITNSSPGFTTAHLVESDLGLYKRVIFPKLNCVYYFDKNGERKLFRRKDHGLCSKSYQKFYQYYKKHNVLISGNIGRASAEVIRAQVAYNIEKNILQKNPKFNICDDSCCITCNVRRWDCLLYLPRFIYYFLKKRIYKWSNS